MTEPDRTPVTYLCDLYALDASTAKFTAGQTGCRLELPALEWVAMGRPGTVAITPQHILDSWHAS